MIVLSANKECLRYPEPSSEFSPSKAYPEYPWKDDISTKENKVYDLVRQTFILAGLDENNIGSAEWNPLGCYIKPGDRVLLKPNWVEDKNKNSDVDDNLACLVTNPSVVRVIVDYVLIALNGEGEVILADAPMQGCNLRNLFELSGYDSLFAFYQKKGIEIRVEDLRKYSVESVCKGVFYSPKPTNSSLGSVKVNLGNLSLHSNAGYENARYKVEDYPIELTGSYHNDIDHVYEVNALPLSANVIINIPKPKTHRLAGFTAACKNFVGITYEKACLPHRVDGDAETGSGDAYYKHSFGKQAMSFFNEKRTEYSRNGKYCISKTYDLLMKASYAFGSVTSRDAYRVGSWYGNDTIWRTIADLNRIVLFADAVGTLRTEQQRKVIHIGDMIISGQKEGPVGPSPKHLGAILFSDNAVLFDRVVCEIMGFDSRVFPLLNSENVLNIFGYGSSSDLDKELIKSNVGELDGIKVEEFPLISQWAFEPHSCWKGHIEKGGSRQNYNGNDHVDWSKKIIQSREMRKAILHVFDWVPDNQMVTLQYELKLGRKPNLIEPQRYTEKLQWYKLNYRDPLMSVCADKVDVRKYMEALGFSHILVPLIGVYSDPAEIIYDSLPNQFVIKDSLGTGNNEVLICRDKSNFDWTTAMRCMKQWSKRGARGKNPGREWVYERAKGSRILIEELLVPDSDDIGLIDYKFFCFNGGAPKYMYVTCDRQPGKGGQFGVFEVDSFRDTGVHRVDERPLVLEIPRPEHLAEMARIARELASAFPHARVDLYDMGKQGIRFGEITFFDGSGYFSFDPDEFDFELGREFALPNTLAN